MAFFSAIAAILLLSLQPSAPSGDLINTISKGDAAPSPMEGLFLCTSEIRGKGYFGLCSDPALRVPKASLTSDSDQFSEAQTILVGRLSQLENDEHWNFRAALEMSLSIGQSDALMIFQKYIKSGSFQKEKIEKSVAKLLEIERESKNHSVEDFRDLHISIREWYLEEKFDSRFPEQNAGILRTESMNLSESVYWIGLLERMTVVQREKLLDILIRERGKLWEIDLKYAGQKSDPVWSEIRSFFWRKKLLISALSGDGEVRAGTNDRVIVQGNAAFINN